MASIRLERLTKRFGSITALRDVTLEISDAEFFAVLGPPGAGKTTLLRTIAGLERPDEGDVYIGGERTTAAHPADRDLAMVFQNLALYSDKTVFDNLAFPLRQRRAPRSELTRRVTTTARTLGIEALLGRLPAKLSGGERQRVALGRALVRDARAYLLDEPLSGLDALLRIQMRAELKRLHAELGRTIVFVTHDQVEALSLADRIAVLRQGSVQQVDTPERVYERPANRFVAAVVGSPPMNFLACTWNQSDGELMVSHPLFTIQGRPSGDAATPDLAAAGRCYVGVRPEHVRLAESDTAIPATVYETEPLGSETVIDLRVDRSLIKLLAPPWTSLPANTEVQVTIEPGQLHVFAENGQLLLSAPRGDRVQFRSIRSLAVDGIGGPR